MESPPVGVALVISISGAVALAVSVSRPLVVRW